MEKTIDEVVTPKRKWDLGTLYAAAIVAKRQGALHMERSKLLELSTEARRAHKFVMTNCDALAMSILMLSGESEESCKAAVDEMQELISDDPIVSKRFKRLARK